MYYLIQGNISSIALSLSRPPREALVTLTMYGEHPRVVRQYVVGALPRPSYHHVNPRMSKAVSVSLLTEDGFGKAYLYMLQAAQHTPGVEGVLRESFEVTFSQCGPPLAPPCLSLAGYKISFGLVNTTSFIFTAYYNAEFSIINPLPFHVMVTLTPTHTYAVRSVFYAGTTFPSLQDLVRRYRLGTVPKVQLKYPKNAIGENSVPGSMNLRGEPFPKAPHPPPRQYEPKGPRYTVEEQHVKYLEWSFNVRVSVESGPQIWDVRWSGERIVYELSLQEIAVLYAGANPSAMFSHLSDSAFGLGDNAKPLVPGVDCPDHARFLPTWIFSDSGGSSRAKELTNAVCVFEHNSGVPLRRHSSPTTGDQQHYGGVVDHCLVVRAIIVEFNYDYILDFVFHNNGALETRVYATGYIMPQWFYYAEDPFGFQVKENVVGSVHHHLFHFKVDLDIGGVSNRYETLDFDIDDRDWPWLSSLKTSATSSSSSSSSRSFQQISFKHHVRQTEKDAVYHYNFDQPKYHIFYNDKKKNKLGNVRAYRLVGRGFSKQLLPSGHPAVRSRRWADYCMAVTTRKDREMKSSSIFSMYDAVDPVVDFQEFLDDDDSILDTDLVSWVTVGMHHIPHTEDVPNTPTVGTEASILLTPYNFFPECPSVSSRDAVRVQKIARDTRFKTYGTERDPACVPPVYGWLAGTSQAESFP
ncbi:hypothetical protein ACOMHN_013074 [Nucella lapillus]